MAWQRQRDDQFNDGSTERDRFPRSAGCLDCWAALYASQKCCTRVWVVQEVAMGTSDPLLVCGISSISWSLFIKTLANMDNTLFVKFGDLGSHALHMHGMRESVQQPPEMSLPTIHKGELAILLQDDLCVWLWRTSLFEVPDPRDKCYVLLGLARNLSWNKSDADYDISETGIILKLVKEQIRVRGNLDLLTLCQPGRSLQPVSWVPDLAVDWLPELPRTLNVFADGWGGYIILPELPWSVTMRNPRLVHVGDVSHPTFNAKGVCFGHVMRNDFDIWRENCHGPSFRKNSPNSASGLFWKKLYPHSQPEAAQEAVMLMICHMRFGKTPSDQTLTGVVTVSNSLEPWFKDILRAFRTAHDLLRDISQESREKGEDKSMLELGLDSLFEAIDAKRWCKFCNALEVVARRTFHWKPLWSRLLALDDVVKGDGWEIGQPRKSWISGRIRYR